MVADDRIPVRSETLEGLRELKESGQTYDELLAELARNRNREGLVSRFDELDEMDCEELRSLDES